LRDDRADESRRSKPQTTKPTKAAIPTVMNKGIYDRGYLPHWDFKKAVQAITFRLADCVPASVIQAWKTELSTIADDRQRDKELHRRIAKYEDAGHGDAVLANPPIAAILQDKLLDGHHADYQLLEWCVMPNHVHVIIKPSPGAVLSEIVRRWKGSSAREINRVLGRRGRLWQREYYDRLIRGQTHLNAAIDYVHHNPVQAGLCATPADWTHSSAGANWSADFSPPEADSENTPDQETSEANTDILADESPRSKPSATPRPPYTNLPRVQTRFTAPRPPR